MFASLALLTVRLALGEVDLLRQSPDRLEIEWRGGDPTIALAISGAASVEILAVESEPAEIGPRCAKSFETDPELVSRTVACSPRSLPREAVRVARVDHGLMTLRISVFDAGAGARRPTLVRLAISAEGNKPDVELEPPDLGISRPVDIAVETTGRVRVAGLAAFFGEPPPFARLSLTSRAGPVAYHAVDVDGDGLLDAEDAIELYGEAGATRYDRRTVYRLTLTPEPSAIAMPVVAAPPGPGSAAPLLSAIHFEQRLRYVINIRNGAEDNFHWAQIIAPTPFSTAFDLPGFAAGSAGEIAVKLRGLTSMPDVDPDHHVVLSVNGTMVADVFFDGDVDTVVEAAVPAGVLLATGSTLTISMPGDTGAVVDGVLLDRFEVEHPRELSGASFAIAAPADAVLDAGPLPGSTVVAMDVTDPLVPRRQEVAVDGVGHATLGLGAAPADLHVSTAPIAPASISAAKGAALRQSNAGADLLIVSATDFRDAADRLAVARRASGWRVRVATMDEVYGAFSLGERDPDAIRALVAHALANWAAPALTHVLLLGDGTFDYRVDLAPFTDGNFVPVHLFDSDFNETADDNAFVDLDGDLLPELAIGRLPAASVVEANALVDKVLAYEARAFGAGFETRLVLVADNAVEEWEQYFFEGLPVELEALLPDFMEVERLQLSQLTPAEMTQAILSEVNEGALWVNYIGHGSVRSWAQEQIFSTTHVPQLANADRPAVFVTMTCSNGLFQFPNSSATGASQRSLAEVALVAANGGAIAFWSPTNPALADPLPGINRAALTYALDGDRHTLGQTALVAKRAADPLIAGTDDLLAGLTLLGDPSMLLKANARPTAAVSSAYGVPTGEWHALDGTASTDPDGQALTYRWTLYERPPESTAFVQNASSPTAHLYPDRAGTYRVILEVFDGLVWSAPAIAAVEAEGANAEPPGNGGKGCGCAIADESRAPWSLLLLALLWLVRRRPRS